MVRSGSHLFAFPPAIGNSTSSAAAVKETLQICLDAARSASALTKAIDVDSNCLANPNHALASHISTLTSLYSLPPLENVRSTAASRLLYRLTMPSSIDSDEDLHAQQRYLRAWCMLHPKERYYLVDLRVAIMCRRLHALAMAAHARDSAGYSGVTSDYPIIVALLGKWSILGVRHMWQRFVESADPVPASHGRFRVGVTAKTQPEYYCEIDQQVLKLGDVRVLRDDYKHILEVRAPCPKEFENNRLSPVQLSRPNVQIIQGSRSKIQRRQNTPIV
ncbi:hypothetical protein HDU82_007952 [Entophlyctis luteolus]|nr:hypothetical protein HDU82_007952 [Entophlyctis luteolus]